MKLPSNTRALLSGAVLATAVACSDSATSPTSPARALVAAPVPLGAVVACPPGLPSGFTLVYCFNFTLQPGVWHGFIVQRSDSQPTGSVNGSYSRTVLSNDYLLVSPDDFRQLGVNELQGQTPDSTYAFQAEFNGTTWFDVVRLMIPANDVPQQVTIAVAKRPLTPSVQAGKIAQQVATLVASGAIAPGVGTSLTSSLNQAIAQLNAGKPVPAANMLQAFINHVLALMSGPSPQIDGATGQALIAAAQAVIARL